MRNCVFQSVLLSRKLSKLFMQIYILGLSILFSVPKSCSGLLDLLHCLHFTVPVELTIDASHMPKLQFHESVDPVWAPVVTAEWNSSQNSLFTWSRWLLVRRKKFYNTHTACVFLFPFFVGTKTNTSNSLRELFIIVHVLILKCELFNNPNIFNPFRPAFFLLGKILFVQLIVIPF